MSLPEDRRQEYLEALGIDSYFPRVRLPGAPESVACEWSPDWQAELVETPRQAPPPPEAPGRPARKSTRAPAPAPAPPANREPQRTEPAVDAPPVATEGRAPDKGSQDDIRLQMLCIRVNGDLAILSAMPHLGPGRLGRPHQVLLQNLLRAAGISADLWQIDEKPFQWPMMQGSHLDNGRAAAATALSAFLQQKQADWRFSRLLVMGAFAVDQLTGDEEESDARRMLDSHDWQCLFTRSLDECLQQPVLKKELWAILRRCRA